jgi:hypothetical protein
MTVRAVCDRVSARSDIARAQSLESDAIAPNSELDVTRRMSVTSAEVS